MAKPPGYWPAYYRDHADERKRTQREARYKRKYGLTIADYENMFNEQGGVCALCSQPQEWANLAVDHDHTNGRVRGLLCMPCNRALGKLGDTEEALRKVLDYVTMH